MFIPFSILCQEKPHNVKNLHFYSILFENQNFELTLKRKRSVKITIFIKILDIFIFYMIEVL